jgi:hypothetical protein
VSWPHFSYGKNTAGNANATLSPTRDFVPVEALQLWTGLVQALYKSEDETTGKKLQEAQYEQ